MKDERLQKNYEAWRDATMSTFPLDCDNEDEQERLRDAFDAARRQALTEVIDYVHRYEDSVVGRTLREIWGIDE
ncbi:MAG: hypothetical protein ACHQC8_07110 [Solirubrobacterales bacterium]